MKSVYMILLSMLVLLTSCDQQAAAPEGKEPRAIAQPIHMSKDPIELELWTYYGGWEPIVEAFQEKHPNVTVHVKTLDDNYVLNYQQALASGDTPDIMIIDSEYFGQFSAISGLENLYDYGAAKYRNDFSESLWNSNLSFDRSELIGLPSGSSPLVTYYRADIMEEHGFPSDPEELGEFMEDPENWLNIARTLKESNSYITSWPMDVIALYQSTQPLFDSEMDFARNTDESRQAIELAKKVYTEGLLSSVDVWTQFGQQAIKSGKSAMLYLGTWGANQLKVWAPESEGLWRQTRLPFNLYGWANSSSFVLPSASQNKTWAYTFVEFCVSEWSMKTNSVAPSAYIPARGQPDRMARHFDFFGGQNIYALNDKLASQMVEFVPTPIDQQAREIWSRTINTGIERERSSDAILKEVASEIRTTLNKEINILKAYLKEKRDKTVVLK